MKILVLNPFAGEAREYERCATVARPDTEITFDTIADVYPLNYVTYIYYRHKCAEAVVERVVRAEQEGFDGVFISCCYDPGLGEARELVDIPVAAAFESAVHWANQISQRYSVISTEPKTSHCYRELADLYGTAGKLASVRPINVSAKVSYDTLTPPEVIVERTLEVARRCVEDDGAEAIVMGCTLQSCPLTVAGRNDAAGCADHRPGPDRDEGRRIHGRHASRRAAGPLALRNVAEAAGRRGRTAESRGPGGPRVGGCQVARSRVPAEVRPRAAPPSR